jgi:hypothetical protein
MNKHTRVVTGGTVGLSAIEGRGGAPLLSFGAEKANEAAATRPTALLISGFDAC